MNLTHMWLAEIVYHTAFRYIKSPASLSNAKATGQSFSCGTYGRLSDRQCTGAVLPRRLPGGGLKHATFTPTVDSVFTPGQNPTAAAFPPIVVHFVQQ